MAFPVLYTDIESIKDRLESTADKHDVKIQAMIEAASRAIDRTCKRNDGVFQAKSLGTQARVYDVLETTAGPLDAVALRSYDGTELYEVLVPRGATRIIDIDPCLSVAEVATDDDDDGIFENVWASAEYDLTPLNAPLNGRPYRELRVRGGKTRTLDPGYARLRITGVFGESLDTPPVIAEATAILVIRLFNRPKAPLGIWGSGAEGVAVRLAQTDPDIQFLLETGGYIDEWVFV